MKKLSETCTNFTHSHATGLFRFWSKNSLGAAAGFRTVKSRDALLSLARHLGIRAPESIALPDAESLETWMNRQAAPFVLKADGSWAGLGVRIISDKEAAHHAWHQMRQPLTFYMALRQLIFERNGFGVRAWLQRERPALSVQCYIDGWPANIGVACWRGQVLATNCAEAVATLSATGPSTVARIVHNEEMIDAASRIVEALGLSGLIGFDFMIDAATGHAHLIEMNPRVTPICAIPLGPGRDLPDALTAFLAGRARQDRPTRTDREVIAYFPDTWHQDPSSRLLHDGYHDVPWDEPALVRRLLEPDLLDRYRILRVLSQLRRRYR